MSIATTDYDHFRDFHTGDVRAPGIDHSWSVLSHHEVFARFAANREWDVAELSPAKFCTQIARNDSDIVAQQALVPHDDVAEIDADPLLDGAGFGHPSVATRPTQPQR